MLATLLHRVGTSWEFRIELMRMPSLNTVGRTAAPAKRFFQHLNATHLNIVDQALGQTIATFQRYRSQHMSWVQNVACVWPPVLRVENRTSAHARAQHYKNLAKRQQHHATFINVTSKL